MCVCVWVCTGSQKKSTHNVRVMRGDPLSLCKHKTAGCVGDVGPNPERLQTAMSLYSDKLSALVITVDGRINSHGSSGLKDGQSNGSSIVCILIYKLIEALVTCIYTILS